MFAEQEAVHIVSKNSEQDILQHYFQRYLYHEACLTCDYLFIIWLYYMVIEYILVLVNGHLGTKVKSGKGLSTNVPNTANYIWQAEGFCFSDSWNDFESIKSKLFSRF